MAGNGLLVVWANLPDDTLDWYENEYIPDMREQNAIYTINCQRTESGFEGEPIGRLDAPWPLCAVYEVEEISKATACVYDKRNHPSDEMLAGPLAQARFDTKTYREIKKWQWKDWDGDASDIAAVTCMEWRVLPEMEDKVLDWYQNTIAPKFMDNEDSGILRLRLMEVDNATVLQGHSYETQGKDKLHTYFSFVEFDFEEYPWEQVFELAEDEFWKQHWDNQTSVKWQLSHYLVKRLYTEKDKAASQQKTTSAS